MKAPDESSIMKDFPENATEWIAADGKRCTDEGRCKEYVRKNRFT